MTTPHRDDEPAVRIGMREIYDVLLGMKAQLAQSIQNGEARDREVARQAERLEALEGQVQAQADRFARWRYMITSGVVTGSVSLATVLVRVLMK